VSVNKRRPHVFVLPEDGANRQLARGFQLEVDWTRQRQMQVLEEAGGWMAVLERFDSDHVAGMESNAQRFMVLLIDLDGKQARLQDVKGKIPVHLTDRVFVLGTLSEPESLKSAGLGTNEMIGKAMAQNCREETDTIWGHDLLRHNAGELARMRERVRPILF
jgi:hypothetical protein